jgi:hypothetical protein
MDSSRQRYGLLLLALVVTFFFFGITEPGELQRVVGTLLVATSLMLALNAAEMRGRRIRVAGAIVAGVVVVVVVGAVIGGGTAARAIAAVADGVMLALAPPAIVLGLVRHAQTTSTVTMTVVAGVLCLYLLVGLFFSSVYIAVQNLGGAPFFASGDAATSPRAIYFSFTTITTTGYGDFTARTNLGHTLSVSEGLLGQIYLVTVVATIIGRLAPRRTQAPDKPS